jgi:hypothetical protein
MGNLLTCIVVALHVCEPFLWGPENAGVSTYPQMSVFVEPQVGEPTGSHQEINSDRKSDPVYAPK